MTPDTFPARAKPIEFKYTLAYPTKTRSNILKANSAAICNQFAEKGNNMPYVTVKPRREDRPQREMTIEDLFNGYVERAFSSPDDVSATRTRLYERISDQLMRNTNFFEMHAAIRRFNEQYKDIISLDDAGIAKMYRNFYIPKRSGGMRRIDAPNEDLKRCLNDFKFILENKFYGTHHTCAFAYVKGRSTIDAVKKHQKNNSRWLLKLDAKGFFPNTTFDFVMRMLGMQFPFCVLFEREDFKTEFEKALRICFLNGGLPQGTPVSPTLTNMMMIPIDFQIAKYASEHERKLVYTRYADDICLSAYNDFCWTEVQASIEGILKSFDAPFWLNKKKTHYGSRAGRDWILGVMYNQDGEITVGHQKKKYLSINLHNFGLDFKNGVRWSVEDCQALLGTIAYFEMVEGDKIKSLVKTYSEKTGTNITEALKEIIAS